MKPLALTMRLMRIMLSLRLVLMLIININCSR